MQNIDKKKTKKNKTILNTHHVGTQETKSTNNWIYSIEKTLSKPIWSTPIPAVKHIIQ